MIAITLPSAAHAAAVSRGLWLLSRPAGVGAGETTQSLAAWAEQEDGTALLILDPAWTLPVHAGVVAQIKDTLDADGTRAKVAALLGPLLSNQTTGLAAARTLIGKGGAMTIGDLLPLLKPALVSAYVAPVRTAP